MILFIGIALSTLYWKPLPVSDVAELNWTTSLLGLGADPSRFLLQAHWLSEGGGFREVTFDGAYCTSLPPGHPFLFSLLFHLNDSLDWLRIAHITLFLSSGILLYFAFCSYSRIYALLAVLVVVCSPWTANLASSFLSEPTGVFLISLFLFLLSRFSSLRTGRTKTSSDKEKGKRISAPLLLLPFLTGIVALWAILSNPALSFPLFGLFLVLPFLIRRKTELFALFSGATLVYLGWQIHCISATGRPAIPLLHPFGKLHGRDWVCTWAKSPDEFMLGINTFSWATPGEEPPDYRQVPEHAFASSEEKSDVIQLSRAWLRAGGNRHQPTPEFQALASHLDDLADRNREAHPVHHYLSLPLQRGALSWLRYRSPSFFQYASTESLGRLNPSHFAKEVSEYGMVRASKRGIRGIYSILTILHHVLTLALVAIALLLGIRSSPLLGSLFAFFWLLFTYYHGLIGPEVRRNIPMIPIALAAPVLFLPISRFQRDKLPPLTYPSRNAT